MPKIFVEGGVIVASILLAFAIDAWWDQRQELAERAQLVEAMYEDFALTRTRLEESIGSEWALFGRTSTYLDLVSDPEIRGSVPVDSLTFLLSGARLKVAFQPSMASYHAALNSGRIGLIENTKLFDAITEFEIGSDRFEETERLFGDIYYRGAIWELRRELGGLRVLGQDPNNNHPPEFLRSDAEMRALIASRSTFAAVENVHQLHVNFMRGLCQMHRATTAVLGALGTMRESETFGPRPESPEPCALGFLVLR